MNARQARSIAKRPPVIVIPGEEWLPVVGYPDYEVSTVGRVRRATPAKATYVGRILRCSPDAQGYARVALSHPAGGSHFKLVHRLLCEAVHGPGREGQEVRHLDGDKTNITPENLAWGTRLENAADMRRHGTHHNTRKTHCKRGHEFTPENTLSWGKGRHCRACDQARRKRQSDAAESMDGAA